MASISPSRSRFPLTSCPPRASEEALSQFPRKINVNEFPMHSFTTPTSIHFQSHKRQAPRNIILITFTMAQTCWQCGAPPKTAHETASPESPPLLSPHRLLTSNDVPLDSETPVVRNIISDSQNELDALNSQINNLEAAMAPLIQKRDRIAEHIRQHRAILSAVRRAPPELVCEIMAFAQSSDDDEDPPNKPPWSLGHICQSWRQCVLAYPAL